MWIASKTYQNNINCTNLFNDIRRAMPVFDIRRFEFHWVYF